MKRNAIERLIPAVFRRTIRPGSPLAAFIGVMEDLHGPSEKALEDLDATFDPRRTSDRFVPFLAGWVDLERLLGPPAASARAAARGAGAPLPIALGCLREIIATAALLSQWRGTKKGLELFLTTATGLGGFRIDDQVPGHDGQPRPFFIHVVAPEAAKPNAELIKRIIEAEKPAYVEHALDFG